MCQFDWSHMYSRRLVRRSWIGVSAVLLAACLARTSYGQVTVKDLTGTDDVGPYYQDVEDAIKRYQARDVDGARKLLLEASKKSTRIAPGEVLLGRILLATNQRPTAYAELERAMKSHPDDPEPLILLGDVAYSEGRVTEAGMLYTHAVGLANKFSQNATRKKDLQARAYGGAALVLEAREQWKEARPMLEAWVKVSPDQVAAHNRLGRTLFELGDRNGALTALQNGAKADPKAVPAEFTLAGLYLTAKEPDKAESWVKSGASKNKSFNAQLAAANLYLQLNNVKQALAHADQAVKLDPKNTDANLMRGMIARLQKDYETSERYLARAHLMSPTNFQALNQLSLVLIEQEDEADKKRALEFAEWLARMAVRTPQAAEANATLGWIQYRTGRNAEAERTLSTLTTFNPETAYFAANVLRDRGRTADALKLLDFALQQDRPFVYRDEAEALRSKLKAQDTPSKPSGAGETPAIPGTGM